MSVFLAFEGHLQSSFGCCKEVTLHFVGLQRSTRRLVLASLCSLAAMVATTARHVRFGGTAVGSRGIGSCTMTSKGSSSWAAWWNGLWHTVPGTYHFNNYTDDIFDKGIFIILGSIKSMISPLELSFVDVPTGSTSIHTAQNSHKTVGQLYLNSRFRTLCRLDGI